MTDEIEQARRMTLRQVLDGIDADTLTRAQRLVVAVAMKEVREVIAYRLLLPLERAMHNMRYSALHRLSAHSGKFVDGRKPGAAGHIRKRVRKLLKDDPNIKNPAIWDAIAAMPPKGWQAIQNSRTCRLDGPKGKTVTKKAIFNVAGEERKRLRKIPD